MELKTVSPDDVDRIAGVSEPVLRNLLITQCYHELSSVIAERMASGANWCTFATWASKQAGQSIRKEDITRVVEARLRISSAELAAIVSAAHALGARQASAQIEQHVRDVFDFRAMLSRTGDAVARGNRKVFEEIAREFALFVQHCFAATQSDAAVIERFCETLRPGDPPEGQRYLRGAFAHYYETLFETDSELRAQLLLLANIEVGLHEQTRLQPEITEAVEVAVPDAAHVTPQLLKAIFPGNSWIMRMRFFWQRMFGRPTPFERAVEALVDALRRQVRVAVTEHLMMLELPGDVHLRLGQDLRAVFPARFARITQPDLLSLLARIDPTRDSVHETGAADWASLSERLHFIADFFRCYHDSPDLLGPPFSAEQVAALRAGRIPQGRL
jgi:hypothetical protein